VKKRSREERGKQADKYRKIRQRKKKKEEGGRKAGEN
jgi:hypothetical protein